jgi:hypothetical protein
VTFSRGRQAAGQHLETGQHTMTAIAGWIVVGLLVVIIFLLMAIVDKLGKLAEALPTFEQHKRN